MGTRSTTAFIQNDKWTDRATGKTRKRKTHLVTCYKQYDGYPTGYGSELAEFLASGVLVKGFGMSDVKQFNGMGCLAAQVINHFKEGTGGYYVSQKGDSQEYDYTVYNKDGKVYLKCVSPGYGDDYPEEIIFDGEPKDFDAAIEERNKKPEEAEG